MRVPKEYRSAIDSLIPGCEIRCTRGGHMKVVGPEGQTVFFSTSPSDAYRALHQFRRDLRRSGLLR